MSSGPLVLGFSTAGPYCGVALWTGTDITAAVHEEMKKGQAERLMPLIEEVLRGANVTFADLDAIGVGIGPGNFTGIRIGVAAARGLALGLGVPAVGVSLLEALAWGHDGPVLASVAAGRDRYYLQRFGAGAARGPDLVAPDDVQNWAHPGLTCIGHDGAEIAARIGAKTAPAPYAPASVVARIAATRWRDDPTPPAPLYLRDADAAPARDAPPVILP